MPNEGASTAPTQDEARDLHRRLLDADPTAPADLAQSYLDRLAGALRARFPNLDEHLCDTAAADAVLALIENPHRYDPSRSSLATFLTMSARGDLLNALEKRRRQSDQVVPLDVVELSPDARNNLVEDGSDPAEIVEEQELNLPLPDVASSESERQVLALVADGERRTQRFVEVLGINHLSEGEQFREVMRVKDRLKRRLRRAGRKSGNNQ